MYKSCHLIFDSPGDLDSRVYWVIRPAGGGHQPLAEQNRNGYSCFGFVLILSARATRPGRYRRVATHRNARQC